MVHMPLAARAPGVKGAKHHFRADAENLPKKIRLPSLHKLTWRVLGEYLDKLLVTVDMSPTEVP
jgi:hypothetical protein